MTTLRQQAADLAAGQRSSVQLTQEALATARRKASLNAFVLLHEEAALREAARADEALAAGDPASVLGGIPIALKDNIDEQGVRCSAGCEAYLDRLPEQDAEVVTRLRAAGAVILGRTNMHELADGVTSENAFFDPVHNPYRPGYHPGGSSGGSAVAVAAGIVGAALGTDTGGSVRIPAALCGVVGFKPTAGRVPTAGVTPLSTTLDHVGVLASTVQDAAAVLDVIADAHGLASPADARGLGSPAEGHRPLPRLGVLEGFGLDPDPRVNDAFLAALATLEELGFRTQPIRVDELARGIALLSAIYSPEAAAHHRDRLAERPDRFSEPVRQDLERGLTARAAERRTRALAEMASFTARLESATADVDLVVSPTTPHPARPFDSPNSHTYLSLTVPFNLAGWPAISIPMGLADGLPVGLQIAGAKGADPAVLAAAARFERAIGPH